MNNRIINYQVSDKVNQRSRNRFWSLVSKQPEGCWIFGGQKSTDGYGRCGHGTMPWTYGEIYAHRIAWRDTHDGIEIPDDHEIDHICRVRSCVNPDHLRCVPWTQNRQNRRHTVPSHLCKLNPDEVRRIRELHAEGGRSFREIARIMGCTHAIVQGVINLGNYDWVI